MVTVADSLRSSLSKNALIAISEMFSHLKRCMEPSLDKIMKILLKKGSDTNAFISEEAERGLIAMVNNCQDSKVFMVLQNTTTTKSSMMKQRLCKCYETLVLNLGNNILFFKDNDKLLNQLANFLADAS